MRMLVVLIRMILCCCVALPPENAQVDFVERFRAFDSACLLCEQ